MHFKKFFIILGIIIFLFNCSSPDGGGGGNDDDPIVEGDTTAPTVAISCAVNGDVNEQFGVTITFSEEVSGFSVSDITVGNGSADNLETDNDTVFTVDIIPVDEGDVTVDIPAEVAEDGAGNGNEAATRFTIYYNPEAPGVLIYSDEEPATNDSPVPVIIVFTEEVIDFTVDDIIVENGTAGNLLTGDNTVFTLDITPPGDATIIVQVPANVCQSLFADNNVESNEFSIVFDETEPGVVIGSVETSPTDAYPIPITITFSEEITDFTVDDLLVGNGTALNFNTSDTTLFLADIYPTAQGDVTVDITAGAGQDPAGNDNTAATQFLITYSDMQQPGVSISTTADPTSLSPFEVTITFTETVIGFELVDIGVTGGTAGNFNETGNPVFTVDITPDGDGTVTISVPADSAQDGAGNPNTAATDLDVLYDGTIPGVSIASTAPDPVDSTPILVTITFTEEVSGFEDTDIPVTNGTAGNLQTLDNIEFTADITPTTGGNVIVDIPADVAQDTAGNGNTAASASFSVVFDDSQAPGVSLSTSASDPATISPIPVTITFTEEVAGFDSTDISVTNGTAGNLQTSDNIVYTADITPSAGEITVTIDILVAVAQDLVGNDTTAAPAQVVRDYDGVAPDVTITSPSSDPTNVSPIPITITFTEIVVGFTVDDIDVENGTAGTFNNTGNPIFTAVVTPSDVDVSITVDVAAGVAQDGAGNDNTAATPFEIDYDADPPTIDISSTVSDPANVDPIPVTITFSEEVIGFVEGEIIVGNGATSNFDSSGNPVFTVDVTPSGSNVTVTVNVAAAVVQDETGNNNTAAPQYSVYFDDTSPAAGITCGEPDPTDTNPFDVTITFNETMTGFTSGDITVGNGSVTGFTDTNPAFTVEITASDNNVSVDVNAGVATDNAGNGNTAATQVTRTVDLENPVAGAGGALSVRSPAATACTLNWTLATDDVTAQANLEYLAYYSDNSAMDTVAGIELNGTAIGTYTANISTIGITGLLANTTYYYNVIVQDEFGKQTAYGKFTDTSRQNLVAYYPFNGNMTDESVNSNNATISGTVSLTTGLDGSANSAYYIGGGNPTRINIPDDPVLNAATQSFTLWIRTNTGAGANNDYPIVTKNLNDNAGYYVGWEANASDGIYAWCGDGSDMIQVDDGTDYTDNSWHQICVTIGTSDITLYVDGGLIGSASHGGSYTVGTGIDIQIGRRSYMSVDEIRFYDRALSGTEATMIFDMENPNP